VPELPDVEAYVAALRPRIVGEPLERVRLHGGGFVLRTLEPTIAQAAGRVVREVRRLGKRICLGLDNDIWLVIHLMIAGRLHWRLPAATLGARNDLAAFDFPGGTLVLTEAGSKRRASLHVLAGESALFAMDPGGIDVSAADLASFRHALSAENQTLKRALTDPHHLSGIGNAYSDEILHAAQLSPLALTHKLTTEQWQRLFAATRSTLQLWVDRLRDEAKDGFPSKSRRFAKRWPCTVNLASRVRVAALRCSASATRTMRPTIALAARPAGSCSPTAACLGSWGPTRRARSRKSKSAADEHRPNTSFQRSSAGRLDRTIHIGVG